MIIEINNSRDPIREIDISRIEEILGGTFPIEYRQFLLDHNGGRPTPNTFWILNHPLSKQGMVQFFLCLKEGDIYNLPIWIKRYKNRIPADLFPIAVDPGGNLICLAFKGENRGFVYFWDHEEEANEGKIPTYSNVYLICDKFPDFINNLVQLQ